MATQTLTVNGDGNTTSGWVAEGGDYTRLQSDDGDTSRLYSPIADQVRQVSLTDTSGLTGKTINSLMVYAKFRSLDPVSNTIQIGIRSGGTDYWGTTKDTVSSTSYILFSETWTTDPATGAPWTTAGLDAVQAGVKKINGVGGAVTYMKAEVDYTDSVSVTGSIKTWDGTAFVAKPVKVWNGTAWVTKPLKRWNGTAWVVTGY